jgi:hypothetical protein
MAADGVDGSKTKRVYRPTPHPLAHNKLDLPRGAQGILHRAWGHSPGWFLPLLSNYAV